jgi:hypothetical protein
MINKVMQMNSENQIVSTLSTQLQIADNQRNTIVPPPAAQLQTSVVAAYILQIIDNQVRTIVSPVATQLQIYAIPSRVLQIIDNQHDIIVSPVATQLACEWKGWGQFVPALEVIKKEKITKGTAICQ